MRSEDLQRISIVFRDMIALGGNSSRNDVIDLSEDAWQLEQLFSLNSLEIDEHPDISEYTVSKLLSLHMPAVKYAMVGIQSLVEMAMRYVHYSRGLLLRSTCEADFNSCVQQEQASSSLRCGSGGRVFSCSTAQSCCLGQDG